MNYKYIIFTVLFTALIIGLLVVGNSARQASVTYWQDSDIACLSNGHEQLALHVHPILKIMVDGVEELVPENIGINQGCMAEIHTHDTTGTIHVESINRERGENFRLRDFFSVWGQSVEREGYAYEIKLNGEATSNVLADIPLHDEDVIEIIYTSQELLKSQEQN